MAVAVEVAPLGDGALDDGTLDDGALDDGALDDGFGCGMCDGNAQRRDGLSREV